MARWRSSVANGLSTRNYGMPKATGRKARAWKRGKPILHLTTSRLKSSSTTSAYPTVRHTLRRKWYAMPIKAWAVSMKHCSVLLTRKTRCSRNVSEKTGSGLPIWQKYGQEIMWRHSSSHATSGTTCPCRNLLPTSSRNLPCSFPTKPDCTTVQYGKTVCG